MKEFFFMLYNLFFYRKNICYYLNKEQHKISKISLINAKILNKYKIKCIAIDFDGVLAPYGVTVLDSEIKIWLTVLIKEFGNGCNIFIFSNQATYARKIYFKLYFPSIIFITKVRKKPYPDGLFYIQQKTRYSSHEIALIDDRIFTGFLCAIIYRSFPILITSPFINYKLHFFQELFFYYLRFFEKKLFKYD